MKKFKQVILLLLPVLAILSACQGQQDGYMLKGTIDNAANMQILLEQAHFDRTNTAMGRATADGSGAFSIQLKEPFPQGLYRLDIGAKKVYFMLDGTEHVVEIKGDLSTIDRMELEVKGSETFKCYVDIVADLMKNPVKDIESARAVTNKACNPLMKAFLTMQLMGGNVQNFMSEFKTVSQELSAYMPGSKYAADLNNTISQIEGQLAQQQAAERIQVGQEAPDIRMKGPDGKEHALSSLRGKVVLLDFWASWCGPCRRENPRVVEIYKKYKDRGFDIFSVSLDGADPRRGMAPEEAKKKEEEGRQKWMAAIKQDGLIWDNHVSDLKHWGSEPAAVYGVQAIPKTFLIGRDGKIIAINPRANLEEELKKVL